MNDKFLGYSPFRLSSSGLVKTGGGFLDSIAISYDNGSTATVNLYDNTSATGDPVYTVVCEGSVNDEAVSVRCGFNFMTGLYVEISNAAFVCGNYV